MYSICIFDILSFAVNTFVRPWHCWVGSALSTISTCMSCPNPCHFFLLGHPPNIMPVPLSEKYRMITIGCPIILQCEVSDPLAQVSWFKDEAELFCKTGLDMKRDGRIRKLMIHSAKVSDFGIYCCSLAGDAVTFHVDVEGDFVALTLN